MHFPTPQLWEDLRRCTRPGPGDVWLPHLLAAVATRSPRSRNHEEEHLCRSARQRLYEPPPSTGLERLHIFDFARAPGDDSTHGAAASDWAGAASALDKENREGQHLDVIPMFIRPFLRPPAAGTLVGGGWRGAAHQARDSERRRPRGRVGPFDFWQLPCQENRNFFENFFECVRGISERDLDVSRFLRFRNRNIGSFPL